MSSSIASVEPRGVAFLRAQQPTIPFEVREYSYIEKGGTGASSAALGVNEHAIIKTLLFQEAEDLTPFIVLQHGDASVDTKKLLKELQRTRGQTSGPQGLGVDSSLSGGKDQKRSRVFMTTPETAQQYTGYLVGGTSPFGVQDTSLRVFMEASLLKLLPTPAPETVAPTKPEDAAMREREIDAWDPQVATAGSFVDFTALDTRTAKDSSLDLVSPAWVLINGGARGTLVALSVRNIVKTLRPIVINVAKGAGGEGEEKPVGKQQQAKKSATSASPPAAADSSSTTTPAPLAATEVAK